MAESKSQSFALQLAVTYGIMLLWICLSAAVILVNKYVLSESGFPYPIALTCTHMLFCSVMAFGLVKSNAVEVVQITADTYLRCATELAGERVPALPACWPALTVVD